MTDSAAAASTRNTLSSNNTNSNDGKKKVQRSGESIAAASATPTPAAADGSGAAHSRSREKTAGPVAAPVLSLGQLDADRRLDFISTNRVVAVLEKAVERLQLLTLLDASTANAAAEAAAGSGETEDSEDDGSGDDDRQGTARGKGGKKGGKNKNGGGEPLNKMQKILARFAVKLPSGADQQQQQQIAMANSNAIIQEAIAASAATSRPAATFVSLERRLNPDAYDDSVNIAEEAAATRRTAAQVTAALADASQLSRRGRPTVGEMLEEQRRLECRYGELLRTAQQLNQTTTTTTHRSANHTTATSTCGGGNDGDGESEDEDGTAGGSSAAMGASGTKSLHGTATATIITTDRALQPCFTHIKDVERAAVQYELKTVSQKLRDHTKYLCLQLKDAPNDGDNWRKIANERSELIALLKATIAELTAGYAESRRNQYQGTGALDGGSFRNSNNNSGSFRGANGSLRRVDSKSSMHSGNNANSTAGGGEGSCSVSQHLDGAADNLSQSGNLSQTHQNKRFGSTMQMRRAVKPVANHPRVPLLSSYAVFARKVLQEEAAQRWADDLVQKERELNQNVKQLQSDLLLERGKREKEVAERNARLHELRVQLREVKRELKQRSDEARESAEAAAEGMQRQAHEQEAALDDKCDALQAKLTVEERTFELFAAHLRERTAAMDALAVEWQQKNPGAMKKTEIKKLDAEQTRQQCAERLGNCERERTTQEERRQERERAAAEAEAAAQAAEKQRQAVYDAASKLQSAVRAMLTREAITKIKKKNAKQKKKRSASVAAAGGKK